MSLFSAIVKGVARLANDKNAENQRKKAQEVAYKQTGKSMKEASKKGIYVNGKKLYKINLQKEKNRINEQHERRENFINDT